MGPKALQKIADRFRPVFKSAKSRKDLIAKMKALGFTAIESSGIAFLSEKKKFVVKLCYFPDWDSADYDKKSAFDKQYKIPSHIEKYNPEMAGGEYSSYCRFVVQPKAETDIDEEECDKFCEKISEIDCDLDVHVGNCGRFKGKLVLIDW